jgi:hypothetical protein
LSFWARHPSAPAGAAGQIASGPATQKPATQKDEMGGAVAVKGLRFAAMNAPENGAPLTAVLAAAVLQR